MVLFFALLFGVFYLLFFLDILKYPSFLNEVPIVGQVMSGEKTKKADIKQDLMQEENLTLKETIDKKDEELQEIQSDSKDLEQRLKSTVENEGKLQEEILDLNEQLLELQMSKKNQAKVYKDTAKYYAEMNAKNAAGIINKLEIEHIIGILSELDPDLAADILQNMPEEKAAQVTKKMLVTAP